MSVLSVAATGAAAEAIARHLPTLVQERFASRLFAQDPALWGEAAREESARRLGWTTLHRTSRPLIGAIEALRGELAERGVDRIVLCGMGGSSLAPEVICATAGVDLVVLDSSDPDMVRACVEPDLQRTAVVVSSKSGSTVETDSQRRAFVAAFAGAGIDPRERVVVVTDPGSPLDQQSRADGYRVVNADPDVGGRYSALTAFGLVPSGLAGADVGALLDEAEEVADLLAADDEANPGLRLGAAIGGTQPLRDKLVLVDDGSDIVGFADWAEQLIAESTGKEGTGILPVVAGDGPVAPAIGSADDVTVTRLVAADATADVPADVAADVVEDSATDHPPYPSEHPSEVVVGGPLGAQLLLWEVATAVAGRLLGINPFDQPDVESAKQAARDLMAAGGGGAQQPAVTDGAVQIRSAGSDWASGADTVEAAVQALLEQLDADAGYLTVMVYLDRLAHADLADLRDALEQRTARPVTFGWGPRFLHSTGQFHKGGPPTGVYLQVTGDPAQDYPVPGQDFTFGEFIAAQAGGDAAVLAARGRPVLRLHLSDQRRGLEQLRSALASG